MAETGRQRQKVRRVGGRKWAGEREGQETSKLSHKTDLGTGGRKVRIKRREQHDVSMGPLPSRRNGERKQRRERHEAK